jgi:hypothetical protein
MPRIVGPPESESGAQGWRDLDDEIVETSETVRKPGFLISGKSRSSSATPPGFRKSLARKKV